MEQFMLAFRPIHFYDEPDFPYSHFGYKLFHVVTTYNKTTKSYDFK